MRSLRSLVAVPFLSLTVAAFAGCSADTTTPDEGDQGEIGTARQALGCPSVATLQQCTAQTPCNLNLSGCDYSNAQLPGFDNTGNMQGTIFDGANLTGAVLGGNTANASFAGANLSGATLQQNANTANLSGANVTGTTFSGNTNRVSCTNLVVGTIPGSSPPAADLPTGLPASCLGNITVTCPPPAACLQPGVANASTGWVCTYAPVPTDTTSGLVHHWTFEEGSGPTALDSAGASNGTLGSSARRATSFDGSGAIALVPTAQCDLGASVDFGVAPGKFGTADFSVSFWVATSFSGPTLGDLIGNRWEDSNGDFLSGRLSGRTGSASIEIDHYGANYNALGSAPVAINDARWHNVVYTRRGATLTQYIDGVSVGSHSTGAPTDIAGTFPFKIGRNLPECLGSFASIDAVYDDVRIYGRALAACDVATLPGGYAGTPATIPDLCTGVTCTASDECHVAGVCSPATGTCSNPAAPDGTYCSTGICESGACYDPTLAFGPAQNIPAGSAPIALAAGDINGDGKQDLVVANDALSGTVTVLLGNGDGTFTSAGTVPADRVPDAVALSDLNGDGKVDMVVGANIGGSSSGLLVFLGNGDGTFQPPTTYPTAQQPDNIVAADLNGDGKLDLVSADFVGSALSVLLGNGDGTFQPEARYSSASARTPSSVAVGDFDGDGKPDLVSANFNSSNASVWLGNGDGTFQPAVLYTTGGAGAISVAVGDLNRDGKLDLAVANQNGNNVGVLLGNGDGTFQTAVAYATGSTPTAVILRDFDGDLRLDIAVANGLSNSVSVLEGNGDGTFQAALTYAAGTVPYGLASADFNGDGKPDLATPNLRSNNVSVLINQSF